MTETFGSRLKKVREKQHFTAKELAKPLGVQEGTIYRWESGERNPRINVIAKIASILGVNISELLADEHQQADAATPLAIKSGGDGERTGNASPRELETLKVPIYSEAFSYCCGKGEIDTEVSESPAGYLWISYKAIEQLDDTRMPYATVCKGNSMIGAGINDGATIVINPAAIISNGDVVAVHLNGKRFVRWLYGKPNGDIILRAANRDYEEIIVSREEQEIDGYFYLDGKVVKIELTPISGR